MAADIRMVFNAPDRPAADQNLKQVMQKYEKSATNVQDKLEENIDFG